MDSVCGPLANEGVGLGPSSSGPVAFGRRVCSVAEWVPHSTGLASGVDSVCGPLANEGVGLGPSSSGPVAFSPWVWVCFDGLTGDIFHLGVAMHGFPRMVGLLAALLEVCLPGLSGWYSFRVPEVL